MYSCLACEYFDTQNIVLPYLFQLSNDPSPGYNIEQMAKK